MSNQNEIYLAIVYDTKEDVLSLVGVTRDTWDNEKMYDDPDNMEEFYDQIKLPHYELNYDWGYITYIEHVNGYTLKKPDLKAFKAELEHNGYIINKEFAAFIEQQSSGELVPV